MKGFKKCLKILCNLIFISRYKIYTYIEFRIQKGNDYDPFTATTHRGGISDHR